MILKLLLVSTFLLLCLSNDLEITEDEEKALIQFHTKDIQHQINMRNITYQIMAKKLKHRQELYPKYWSWLNIIRTDADARKKRFLQDDPFSNFTESELKYFEAKSEKNRTQQHDHLAIGYLKLQMNKLRSTLTQDTQALNDKIRTLFTCA